MVGGGGLLGSCRARGGESLFLRPFFLSAVVTYVVVVEEVAVVVVAWAHTAAALMVVVDVEDRLHKRTQGRVAAAVVVVDLEPPDRRGL